MIGGITVDGDGRTRIPGLWAAGEVTSTGLHGANRLASNSLLEGLVYGAHAGKGAALAARSQADDYRVLPIEHAAVEEKGEPLDLSDIRNSLTSLMWRAVGVRRDAASLRSAQESIKTWCRYVLPRQFKSPPGWELQNMLVVAHLMVESALMREESRGVHLRTDFPIMDDDAWQRHLSWCRGDADVSLE